MNQTGLILFARFDSTRLPGKMLMDLGGRPLLGRVLDRAQRVKGQHKIVVATSDRDIDDPIVRFAEHEDIAVFRGSIDNVAGRALACCETFGFDRFARICADRPFLPYELIDRALALQQEQNLDLATNALEKSYPSGTMTEVITRQAMQRVCDETSATDDLEHVTKFIYTNAENFRIANFSSGDSNWASLNLSIDTQADMDRTNWMFDQLGDHPEQASIEAVIALTQKWEEEN